MDQRGRVRLLDHGRAVDTRTRLQRRPPDHPRAHRARRVAEHDITRLLSDRRLRLPGLRQPTLRQCIRLAGGDDQPHVHAFEPLVGRGLPVALVVLGMEHRLQRRDLAAEKLRVGDRDRDGVLLADIAQIRHESEHGIALRNAVARRLLAAGGRQLVEHAHDGALVERAEEPIERAHEILPPGRHQHAERREGARHFRHDHLRDENLARDRDRVQRPRPAERDHRRGARVDSLVDRHCAHRERHGGVRDLHDAEGCLRHREPQRTREPRLDRALGGGAVEPHGAVEKALGVDAPENEIGVGHDRVERALAVGGRPRIGTRALRPDMDAADGIAPGDRAATGADLHDIDDRELHRLARGFAADHIALFDRGRAVGDQAGLGGGAAHVEADGALEAEHAGEPSGADHAGDGT